MTRIHATIALAIALTTGTPSLGAGLAHANKKSKHVAHEAKVSIEAARKIALDRVPGMIKTEELEREHRRWIYSFLIKPERETKKIVKEVNVDADSGVIVDVETEKD